MRHSGMDCQNLGARTVSRGGGAGLGMMVCVFLGFR